MFVIKKGVRWLQAQCSSIPASVEAGLLPTLPDLPSLSAADQTASVELFQHGCFLLAIPLRLSAFPLRRRDIQASC